MQELVRSPKPPMGDIPQAETTPRSMQPQSHWEVPHAGPPEVTEEPGELSLLGLQEPQPSQPSEPQ